MLDYWICKIDHVAMCKNCIPFYCTGLLLYIHSRTIHAHAVSPLANVNSSAFLEGIFPILYTIKRRIIVLYRVAGWDLELLPLLAESRPVTGSNFKKYFLEIIATLHVHG